VPMTRRRLRVTFIFTHFSDEVGPNWPVEVDA
jgi:hypothetical protein